MKNVESIEIQSIADYKKMFLIMNVIKMFDHVILQTALFNFHYITKFLDRTINLRSNMYLLFKSC